MKLSDKEKNRLKTNYGPWAIITGASSGIGLEITRLLASSGLNLVINGRNAEKLNDIEKEITSKYEIEVKVVAADVSENQGIEQVIEACRKRDVGLLVQSAGFGTSGSFLDTSLHAEKNMLRVNCEAVLSLTHYFAQQFKQKQKGGIILMSSLVAFQGVPYAANYAATKSYIQSLAEALAHELKPFGVDVLSAAPGPVNSGFGNRANMQMVNALKPEDVGAPILKALGRKTTVLPGTLTKILIYSLRIVPRWGKVRIMKMVMGGMTKHQRA